MSNYVNLVFTGITQLKSTHASHKKLNSFVIPQHLLNTTTNPVLDKRKQSTPSVSIVIDDAEIVGKIFRRFVRNVKGSVHLNRRTDPKYYQDKAPFSYQNSFKLNSVGTGYIVTIDSTYADKIDKAFPGQNFITLHPGKYFLPYKDKYGGPSWITITKTKIIRNTHQPLDTGVLWQRAVNEVARALTKEVTIR